MRDIQIGCIGCGFIADIHLRNAQRMPGVHIRALADIRESAAQSFHQRFQSDYWTVDAHRLFADPALDAVLICTYYSSHAELAIAAARGGKHVFLEKPMATSSADCVEIIRACEVSGVKLALDLKFRFTAAVREVKQAIEKPLLVVSQTSMDQVAANDGKPDSRGWGILEDLGAHSLDLACFFAGSEPTRIFALGNRMPHRQAGVLDLVAGTIEFESGCLASFIISDLAEWSQPSKWFFEVADGRRNALIHNHCRSAVLGGEMDRLIDQSEIPPHEIGSYEALADFIEAVRENRPPTVGATHGLRFALMSETLLESIRCGKPVSVTGPEGIGPWAQSVYAGSH